MLQMAFFRSTQARAQRRRMAVIGSFHDFKQTPSAKRLADVEAKGRALGVDVVKIAAVARTANELARLYALPAAASGKISVLGMGALGGISRVALPAAGSCLVYGALDKQGTAPGQLTCDVLAKELKRWGIRSRS